MSSYLNQLHLIYIFNSAKVYLPMKTNIWWWEYRNNIDTAKVYNKINEWLIQIDYYKLIQIAISKKKLKSKGKPNWLQSKMFNLQK